MLGLRKLDRIDINILSQLQNNGRLTNVELADAVGLSPSPCLARVKRLEGAGYILRYAARLNLPKLVDHITVFTQVTLSDHRKEDFIKFESGIRRFDAVQKCHLVSGGYDYLLKFITRSVASYQALMETILERNIGIYFQVFQLHHHQERISARRRLPAVLDERRLSSGRRLIEPVQSQPKCWEVTNRHEVDELTSLAGDSAVVVRGMVRPLVRGEPRAGRS